MTKQINNFLDDKTNQHLLAIAIECKTFDEFESDVGWEDWMYDFLERLGITTEEDELLNDIHCNLINKQLLKVWDYMLATDTRKENANDKAKSL